MIIEVRNSWILLVAAFVMTAACSTADKPVISYVNRMIGTASNGNVTPVVSVPFGMIQMGVDTHLYGSGYNYNDSVILGISHVHKSGGGCNDFLDISFMPAALPDTARMGSAFDASWFQSPFSHEKETATAGFYQVLLEKQGIDVQLAATERCGIQQYTFATNDQQAVLIDLKHGSRGSCTICPEDNFDTVKIASIEIVDPYTIRGKRISNGWTPEQHVYFYTRFSKPVVQSFLYVNNQLKPGLKSAEGTDIKLVLVFDGEQKELNAKTAISSVDVEGAAKNFQAEIADLNFTQVLDEARRKWNDELSKVQLTTNDEVKKEIFYTSLYHTLMYPMLFSDVDGYYRGPDLNIYKAEGYNHYGKVVGLWDTFRAAVPLLTFLRPDVVNDYIRTFHDFYKVAGQLPIWVLDGQENYQMLGLHSLPVIADAYYKGIRDYDAEALFEAMKVSAMRDTTGFSMRYFVGLKNYKKYGYVPADLEMEAVARTLEYAYNDWNIAQMAQMLGKEKDYQFFMNRSQSYRNVFDPAIKLMRGRMADGSWRTPFDPFASNHRRDDYCEGNAWQWSFFVPHDVQGLAELMGGKDELIAHLDSLFGLHSELTGENVSHDISGLIGQYAHGNEPSHHIAYMYNYLQQPRKTQYYVDKILNEQYSTRPDGISGNEDTGQMSAWYVMSSLGLYPVRHGNGEYALGSPQFEKATLRLPNGKELTISARNRTKEINYFDAFSWNGKKLSSPFVNYQQLKEGGKLEFFMER